MENLLTKTLLRELLSESRTTKKILSQVPDNKYSWQPHEKSMTVQRLANHVAELHTWVTTILTTDELNFDTMDYKPNGASNSRETLAFFESCLESARDSLEKATDEKLQEPWQILAGGKVYIKSTRGDMISNTLNHIVHHRAQLGVYLRLLDVPLPGSYGPSADEAP
ncbi:MAG: DinB family protein [Balneolaceae bacterium]|nr:DinB family protein [Balneolaceae bacterium]